MSPPLRKQEIVDVLRRSDFPLTSREIAARTAHSLSSTKVYLSEMLKSDVVTRKKVGISVVYFLNGVESKPATERGQSLFAVFVDEAQNVVRGITNEDCSTDQRMALIRLLAKGMAVETWEAGVASGDS